MLVFFRMTIKGDELIPQEVQHRIDLPSEIYLKGSMVYKYETPIMKKTNRWVYSVDKSCKNLREAQSFLTQQLKIIFRQKTELKKYIEKYQSVLDLIFYTDNKSFIRLSKSNLKILSELGINLMISFH